MKWKDRATINQMRVKDLRTAKDLRGKDEVMETLTWRLELNLQETGNPFHHKAADVTIVDADPTNEHLLSRLPVADRELIIAAWTTRIKPNALPAVPVDRLHYGSDMYNE